MSVEGRGQRVLEGWPDWGAGRGPQAGGQARSSPPNPPPHTHTGRSQPVLLRRPLLWRASYFPFRTPRGRCPQAVPAGVLWVTRSLPDPAPFPVHPAAAPLRSRADAPLAPPAGLSRTALPQAAVAFWGPFLHRNSKYCHLKLCWPPFPTTRKPLFGFKLDRKGKKTIGIKTNILTLYIKTLSQT